MMRSHLRSAAFLVALAVWTGVGEAQAQFSRPDPSAAKVAAALRAHGYAPSALVVLTQAHGPRPRRTLDDIADTLVAIAVSVSGDDLLSSRARKEAVHLLAAAGVGHSGIVGVDRAIPYSGAVVRLMRIVETAGDVGVRGMALASLPLTSERHRLVGFLRDVARLQNAIAYHAVAMLVNECGPEGLEIARGLFRDGTVSNENGKRLLRNAAHIHGWRS